MTDILDSSQAAAPSAPAARHDPGGRPPLSPPQAGLRERKKARTRASLREHALRLFREKGYQNTTVEQIAAAAEVSPSTFFRYFPTKEDLVLQDDMDVRMIEALEQQPPDLGPVAAVRAASRQMFDSYTVADMVDVPVQINGKHRGTITVKLDTTEDAVLDAAMRDSAIGRYLDGKQIRKKVYVKNRILNLVVGD